MAARKTNTAAVAANEKEDVVKSAPAKKEYGAYDPIVCRSVIQGGLYVQGPKSKEIYSFSEYGDETEIEYRDLAALIHSKDRSVFNPWFVVDDDEFIENFAALKKFYAEQYSVRDIRAILQLPLGKMEAEIERLPKTAFESLKSIAAKQVANGNIDSVRKIRILDGIFGTDLNLISEIFSDS